MMIFAWLLCCYAWYYSYTLAGGIDAIYGRQMPFGAYGALDEIEPGTMHGEMSEKEKNDGAEEICEENEKRNLWVEVSLGIGDYCWNCFSFVYFAVFQIHSKK